MGLKRLLQFIFVSKGRATLEPSFQSREDYRFFEKKKKKLLAF